MACVPVLSNYFINKLLNVLTNQGTFSPPGTLYVALYTTNPGVGNTGTEVSTSGTNYIRQPATWPLVGSVSTSIANSNPITYPTATASWGTIAYMGLFDAVSGGNLLMFAPVTTPFTVNIGNIAQIAASQLTMTFQ